MSTHKLFWTAGALAAIVALAAALSPVLPGAPTALAFDRAAVAAGQWWRLLTGHVVHWTGDHLLWDLAVFVVLSLLAIRLSPARYLFCLPTAALAISLAIWFWRPDLPTYRGLSGLDSALFVLIVTRLLAQKTATRQWVPTAALLTLLTAFAGKTAYEFLTGRTLFIQDLGARITCVPLAHVAGGLVGAIVGCSWTRIMFRAAVVVRLRPGGAAAIFLSQNRCLWRPDGCCRRADSGWFRSR